MATTKKRPFFDDRFRYWAKCEPCCRTGRGVKVGNYFSRAYTERQWNRGPVCDNCSTPMTLLYEVIYDSED